MLSLFNERNNMFNLDFPMDLLELPRNNNSKSLFNESNNMFNLNFPMDLLEFPRVIQNNNSKTFNMQGIEPKNIKINIDEQQIVKIEAEQNDGSNRQFRSYAFNLPENVDLESIDSKLENGSLCLKWNVIEEKDDTRIPIKMVEAN